MKHQATYRNRKWAVLSLIVMGVMVSSLAFLGCDGDDFTEARPTDLQNRSFTFPNGAPTAVAAQFGVPANTAFTLEFGDFQGGIDGPVALISGTPPTRVNGTVTVLSCRWNFPGRNLFDTLCDINKNDGRLDIGNGVISNRPLRTGTQS